MVIRFASPILLVLPLVFLAIAAWLIARQSARGYALRALTILLLLLALAGPEIRTHQAARFVYLLVDRSGSVARGRSPAELVEAATRVADANPDRTYGLIEFADGASLVSPLGEPIDGLSPGPVDDDRTRLVTAIELAIALLPPEGSRQLVLLTDGRATDELHQAIGAAQLARVPISVVPVGETIVGDAILTAFRAPTEVQTGRPFTLEGEIEARQASHSTVALYRDGALLAVDEVPLEAGRTRVEFVDTIDRPGSRDYQLVVKADGDGIAANDRLSRLVRTTTRPPVLLVDRGGDSVVSRLLDATGVRYAEADAIPSLAALSEYAQIVLAGVPLDTLTLTETRNLERFARNLGGGVLIVQGEDEVRGFAPSALEGILPVSYSVPEKEQEPSLAIVYLLDRSSSMRALTDGVAKIRILRNAAAASITLLPADTKVGVIAFDDVHRWMIPIAPVGEGASVYAALRTLRAEGGTDLYYPLDDALTRLAGVEARSKHLILITDGKTTHEERDYPGLLERLRDHQEISLSAIALGDAPNLSLLGSLVDAGGGALYRVTDFLKLPQLTMQVTQRLSRSRFVTGTVEVSGPLADELAGLPPLDGYVLTFPRPSARTALWVGEDPLFSTWQVGLGTVSVLNTDLAGAWSAGWVGWPRASTLFEALLRANTPPTTTLSGLRPTLEFDNDDVSLVVDAREPGGDLSNFLALDATLLPTGNTFPVPQVGPGLYHSAFPTPDEGGYAVRLFERDGSRATTVSFTVPYAREYRATGNDREALVRIVDGTGGALLENRTRLPDGAAETAALSRPIDRLLLLAGLGLFVLDLAVRKIPRRRPLEGASRGRA